MLSTRKRSRLFVDYPVQGSLVRQLLIHWAIACAVIFLYLFLMQVFSAGMRRPFTEYLSGMWNRYGILLVVLATVFPVFVFDSIRLSHRFAGPMVPFGKALEKLARGEKIEAMYFRKSDFWQQLATNLNSVASKLDLVSDDANQQEATS